MLGSRIGLARAMCVTCRVAGPCLNVALVEEAADADVGRRFWVRGGLTGPERESLATGRPAGIDAFLRFALRRAAQAA